MKTLHRYRALYPVFLLIIPLALLSTACLEAQDVAYLKHDSKEITIGNSSIERIFAILPGGVTTSRIKNKISGSVYDVQSDEFALRVMFSGLGPAYSKLQNGENSVLLTSKDFVFQGYVSGELKNNGKMVSLKYSFDQDITAFTVSVNYEVYPGDCYLRKWIELSDSSYGMEFLDAIYLESLTFENRGFSHGQFGQPVFINDIFLGVEYPTVQNDIEAEKVKTGYVVGEKITKEVYQSHTSIIGAASSAEKLEQTFMQYVDHLKVEGTRPFLLYNSWYDLRRPELVKDSGSVMNERNIADRIHAFKKYLTKYNITLNAFVLDDGWDNYNSIWEIDSTRFGTGFTPIVSALDSIHTALGLWASPFGGYDNRDKRTAWAAEHGYETSGDFICVAGEKYKAAMKSAMTGYTKNYSIGYFKWDGFLLTCSETNHGHLPGIYSREALVSSYIGMMQAVRKANPDIFLNITSGTWLSPWWLKYADCIWMQGADYAYAEDVPSINERDKAITYKDAVLWDNFQKQHLLFPMSSLMTHGIIQGNLNLLGGENESLDSFSNEVMMYFGRGVMLWELYVSPEVLSDDEWNAIASSINWAKANKDVLENTKMILGDPLKREIYGYVHVTKDKGILLLRNPDIAAKEAAIKLTPDLGDIAPSTEYFVKIIYPYNLILPDPVRMGQTLSIEMEGYEVLAAELIPSDKIDNGLAIGVRYSIKDGNLIVYGAAGEKKVIESIGKKKLADVQFGNKADTIKYKEETPLENNGAEYVSHVTVNLPNQYKNAKFGFLIESTKVLKDTLRPEFSINVNGVNKKLTIAEGQGKWFWITAVLDPGENTIVYSVKFKENAKGKISSWILSDKELTGQEIKSLPYSDNEILPSKPYGANNEREIIFITTHIF